MLRFIFALLLLILPIKGLTQIYDVAHGHFMIAQIGAYDATGANRRFLVDLSPAIDASFNLQLSDSPAFLGIGTTSIFWNITSPDALIGNRYELYLPIYFVWGGNFSYEAIYLGSRFLLTYDEGQTFSKDVWHGGFALRMFYRRKAVKNKFDIIFSIDVSLRYLGAETDTGIFAGIGLAIPITGRGY